MADEHEIAAYYDRGNEEGRLGDWGRLEFLRTLELLARFLPAPPATILDVGGAAGAYALPLAGDGYEVHLLDPVALHVEQARAASGARAAPLASTVVGDARELPFADASVDVVLMLGPLYHLTQASDRGRALRRGAPHAAPRRAAGRRGDHALRLDARRHRAGLPAGARLRGDRRARPRRRPAPKPRRASGLVHHGLLPSSGRARARGRGGRLRGLAPCWPSRAPSAPRRRPTRSTPGSTTPPSARSCCARSGAWRPSRACSARAPTCWRWPRRRSSRAERPAKTCGYSTVTVLARLRG